MLHLNEFFLTTFKLQCIEIKLLNSSHSFNDLTIVPQIVASLTPTQKRYLNLQTHLRLQDVINFL